MKPLVTLRRLRLEVDRTIRTRSFFARAIRDELADEAYAELLVQLAGLLRALGSVDQEMSQLALEDLESLGCPETPLPCPAVRLFGAAEPQFRVLIPPGTDLDVGLTVIGTSWTLDAIQAMRSKSRRASAFLAELGARGPHSVNRLAQRLERSGGDPGLVCAYAELARGALLGIAEDLEQRWPANVFVGPIMRG